MFMTTALVCSRLKPMVGFAKQVEAPGSLPQYRQFWTHWHRELVKGYKSHAAELGYCKQ